MLDVCGLCLPVSLPGLSKPRGLMELLSPSSTSLPAQILAQTFLQLLLLLSEDSSPQVTRETSCHGNLDRFTPPAPWKEFLPGLGWLLGKPGRAWAQQIQLRRRFCHVPPLLSCGNKSGDPVSQERFRWLAGHLIAGTRGPGCSTVRARPSRQTALDLPPPAEAAAWLVAAGCMGAAWTGWPRKPPRARHYGQAARLRKGLSHPPVCWNLYLSPCRRAAWRAPRIQCTL